MKYLLLPLLLISATFTKAQLLTADTIPLPFSAYSGHLDEEGFTYILGEQGQLLKLDSMGRKLVDFAPSTPVKPGSITNQTSLKIVIFYPSLQEFVVLDRFAALLQRQSLPVKGYVSDITLAPDGTLWFLEDTELNLIAYDPRFGQILQAVPLLPLLQQEETVPNGLATYGTKLLVHFSEGPFMVFDRFGNLLTTLPLEISGNWHINNEKVYFLKENNLHIYNLGKAEKELVFVHDAPLLVDILFRNNKIYKIYKDKLIISMRNNTN